MASGPSDDTGWATADLSDEHPDHQVLLPGLVHFGGRHRFSGPVRTVVAPEDNTMVRATLEDPGNGAVLVVDGLGSRRCALLGDNLADLGVRNGWSGIIVYGCLRDAEVIATMPVGVMALGSMPRKSVKRGQGAVDVPVSFLGGTAVPGALLWADTDGVVLEPC